MKNVRNALAAAAAVLFACAAWAAQQTVGGITWTYTISGNEATVGNGSSSAILVTTSGNITVPSTLGGKPVTRIGSSAFQNCASIKEVTIPNSVLTIGPSAFMGCTGLNKVTLSVNLTGIGNYAFYNCSDLDDVNFPDGLKELGTQAFYGCSNMEFVALPDSLTSLGNNAFKNCTNLAWVYLPAFFTGGDPRDYYFSDCPSYLEISSSEVVDGMRWHFRIVGDGAEPCDTFGYIPTIDNNTSGAVTIPSTLCNRPVTSIGERAFAGCDDITSVAIPSGVTRIRASAFWGCYDMTSVSIPSTVTQIDDDAFDNALYIATVYVDKGDTARVRTLLENSGYDLDGVAFVDGSEPVAPVAGTWYTTRAEAFAAARQTGKKVFMICGRDTCGNTMYTKNVACEDPKAKAELVAKCILWYSNCDTQKDENYYYWPQGKFTLPVVCVIDPDDDRHFLVRKTNYQEPEDILSLLAGIPYPGTDEYAGLDPFYPGEMPGYKVVNPADIWDPIQAPKAVTLMGALYYGNDVVGVLELKVGKLKNNQGKVSGTATMLDGKKYTLKAQKCGFGDTLASTLTLDIKGGGSMRIAIGSIGGANVFSGKFDKWHVQTANVGGIWGKSTATVNVAVGSIPAGALVDLLPTSEKADASGGKWSFGKAASVKWTKARGATEKTLVVNTSKGTNLSGMKITYTPKKGTFKGSFKVYALVGSGASTKLKKYTVNVNGVVVDGIGRGKATCKSPVISWSVTVD